MPPKVPQIVSEPWWKIALRHFTTIVFILGSLWWLATPRVEAFIQNVVDARISRIENQLDRIEDQLIEINNKLKNHPSSNRNE